MVAWLLLSFAGLTEPSDAASAEARRLYSEARQAMAEERYEAAALSFEAASRLKPHAVALYTAAQAWEQAEEPARAADAYALALETPMLSPSQAQLARERLAALAQNLVLVSVLGAEGTAVTLDDHTELPVPARVHASPGRHVLLIVYPDGEVTRREIVARIGTLIEIDTEEKPTAEKPAAPKPVPLAEPALKPAPQEVAEPQAGWGTVGYITAGAGGAALLGGVFLGLSANSAEAAYKAGPTQEALDHATDLQLRTNLMFILGGVLSTAGVGLVLWDSMSGSGAEQPAQARLQLRAGGRSIWAWGVF